MERKDKIKNALYKDYQKGSKLRTSEIINCVTNHYPDIPTGSILPSDFCCNHKNKDLFSGKYHIFKKLDYAYYELL
jgi:hypothetical protein